MARSKQVDTGIHRIGLDIGSHSIKAVETAEHGSDTIIRSAASTMFPSSEPRQGIPEGSMVVNAIKQLWSFAAWGTNRVVLALPPEHTYVKWLNLDASNEEELENIIRTTAARGAPFPAEDAVIDYRVISARNGPASPVKLYMTVAASSREVNNLLETAERAGLEPVAVDICTAAALRSFTAQRRMDGPLWGVQPTAHCIIGARGTTIAVVREGAMEFARTVPVGGNDFTECIVDAAGVDWPVAERIKTSPDTRLTEDGVMITSHSSSELRIPCASLANRLSREILRSIRFFASQYAEGSYLGMIGTVTLSGGGALLKGIDVCLQQYGLEVKGIINPFSGYAVDAEGNGIQQAGDKASAYSTAVGLAIGDYWGRQQKSGEALVAA